MAAATTTGARTSTLVPTASFWRSTSVSCVTTIATSRSRRGAGPDGDEAVSAAAADARRGQALQALAQPGELRGRLEALHRPVPGAPVRQGRCRGQADRQPGVLDDQ